MQPVFLTTGPSRRFRFGRMTICLQHASPRHLALAGRPTGMALAALWYLDKKGVSATTIAQIKRHLPPDEFEALRSATLVMPAWMKAIFPRHASSD